MNSPLRCRNEPSSWRCRSSPISVRSQSGWLRTPEHRGLHAAQPVALGRRLVENSSCRPAIRPRRSWRAPLANCGCRGGTWQPRKAASIQWRSGCRASPEPREATGGIHIVMVGKGDERLQIQPVLDLPALEFKRSTRRQERSPVPTTKVWHHTSSLGAPLRAQTQRYLQEPGFVGILQDKAKTLARMVGVAVQGHPGAKTVRGVRLLPKAGECLAQRSSLDIEIGQRDFLERACQKDMKGRLRLEHFPANLFFNRVVTNPIRQGATVEPPCSGSTGISTTPLKA